MKEVSESLLWVSGKRTFQEEGQHFEIVPILLFCFMDKKAEARKFA